MDPWHAAEMAVPRLPRGTGVTCKSTFLGQGVIEVLVPLTSQVGLRLVVIDITLHEPDP